ncbi:MAG TPA: S1/P1 nuclease [Candidatus Methylomirabilis sp.]|nr:S1/P1 nuclease [Candidatus Methylomirabilis sp.]
MKRISNGLFAISALLCVVLAPPASGWGCKGHQTVALIAEKYLTPEAKHFVQKLLAENPIDPKLSRYCGNATHDTMADASTWADDVRSERKNGPWHYIDIPRGARHGPLEPYCGTEGCVTKAIMEQLAVLKDKSADGAKRADALRYVIHFVGDLHQPLHDTTNADEGGNCAPVKYLRRNPHQHNHSYSPNLHSIWDTAIPERDAEGADAAEYAETIEGLFTSDIEAWQKAGIHLNDWVWEGFEIAETTVYGNLTPSVGVEPNVPVHSCTDDNDIGDRLLRQNLVAGETYQEKAAPVVERQFAAGGVRLAMILNEAAKAAQ